MEAKRQAVAVGPELLEAPPAAAGGLCVGTLVSAEPGGGIRVVYPGLDGWDPLSARSTVSVTPRDVGRQVVLAFEQSDPRRPIVLGLLQPNPVQSADAEPAEVGTGALEQNAKRRVQVDGRTVRIEAERELVLQCGKSSIVLRASGEVVVKGLKIVSRARQTNKIKGGNVLIN